MKIAILSPHRDDAAFSLSLTVRALLAAQHSVVIVCCFTRSSYAPYWDVAVGDSTGRLKEVTSLRAGEDERWRTMFQGDLKLADAALEDAPLRLGCGVDEVCHWPAACVDNVSDRIGVLFQGLDAEAAMLPLALGRHVDHVTARDALMKVVDFDRIPVAFYEDLPYAARPGAAPQIGTEVNALNLNLKPGFCGRELERAGAEQFKLRCASVYASQINVAEAKTIAGFSCRYGGRERLWATPCWRESGPMWTNALTAVNAE